MHLTTHILSRAAAIRKLINTDISGLMWAFCLLACTIFLRTNPSPIVERCRFFAVHCLSGERTNGTSACCTLLFTRPCPWLTLFALDLEPDADTIVFTFHNQSQAHPRVYSTELIASAYVACRCITTGDRFVDKQSFILVLPADPYQILGPTSSRLANPGKIHH